MNDRFKFRAWHKPTQKMFDIYEFNAEFVFRNTINSVGTEYNPALIDDCILEQCTGVKDRNGTLIFENDIVYDFFEDSFGVVHFDEKTAKFVVIFDNVEYDFDQLDSTDLVVMGNIHENPELLENDDD